MILGIVLVIFFGFSMYVTSNPQDNIIEDVFLNNQIKWVLEHKEADEKVVVKSVKESVVVEKESRKMVFVSIENFKFNPKEINISSGTTVVWTNNNGASNKVHMIVSQTNIFRSERLYYGESFNFTFKEKGTYKYFDPIYKSELGGLVLGIGEINVV